MAGLNARQKLFIKNYLVSKNATKAAIAAGYSADSARTEGPRLLHNPAIKARINRGLAEQEEDLQRKARVLGVTKERMIAELARVAFSNMNDFAIVTENDHVRFIPTSQRKIGTGHAIKKISESVSKEGGSTSLELHSKDRAQELLCKLLGWTKDEMNLNMPQNGVQVTLVMPSNGSEARPEEKD